MHVYIGREGQEVSRFHRDSVHYSSHFVRSLPRLSDQLFMVVCVHLVRGDNCSLWRVVVHATGIERHSYAKYSS